MSDDAEHFSELHADILREARAYEDAAAQPLPASANDDSGAIIAFWAGLVVAVLTLLGALAGAAVATGTIVGLPAAPVLIGIGIATFLAAGGAGVAILYVAAGSARATIASAQAGITQWPQIATS